MNRLRSWLEHPLTRGLDLDDPATTCLRRRVIVEKPFLHALYAEWYRRISDELPAGEGPVLELGSGAGFMREFIPGLITSEVFHCDGIEAVLDAHRLPFADRSLRAIVMTDVFHHLRDARLFLVEAARCVRPGSAVVMIEPWVTPWSRLVYGYLHHEPFNPRAQNWSLAEGGPLSTANGALPWIIFARDRERFELEFPEWEIEHVVPLMPFRYLLSGGVSMRSLMPGWSFPLWRAMERILTFVFPIIAMFALIRLHRKES